MMHYLKRFILTLVFVLMVAVLTACGNSYNAIDKDFSDLGWEYYTDATEWIGDLLTEFEEDEVIVTTHVFRVGEVVAIILEFDLETDLENQLDTNTTLQTLIQDYEQEDLVNGNCLLIPFPSIFGNVEEMITIFQGEYDISDYYKG
ncbi:MAG: hypothetical protein KJ971_05485 [Firmicutes bacterium]|nr:hypothetical protein [Bacillota bacterium]